MTKTIYLVRHGEAKGNFEGFFQGWLDCDLTDNGILQAKLLALQLHKKEICCVFTSPLKRARDTAEIIAEKCLIEEVIIIDELKEFNCGLWQGLTRKEVEKISPKEFFDFRYHPDKVKIPDGETLLQLQKRAMLGLEKILRYAKDKKNICIVAHGYLNKTMLCGISKQPLNEIVNYPQGNTAINVIKYDGEYKIIEVNNLNHL